MQYGLCNLSIVALRNEPADQSELTSQVLYGELFKVLEQRRKWSRIRLTYDGYEGWVDNKQFRLIEQEEYTNYTSKKEQLCSDLVNFITDEAQKLQPIVMGSVLNAQPLLNHTFDGETLVGQKQKNKLIVFHLESREKLISHTEIHVSTAEPTFAPGQCRNNFSDVEEA